VPAGQDEPSAAPAEEAVAADAAQTSLTADLSVTGAGLFNLHLRGTPLVDAIRLLSRQAQRNVAISSSVDGTVTTDAFGVSFEEALQALLAPLGYTWFEHNGFVYVCRPEERDAIRSSARQPELRIFELNYISASEVAPVVEKLLSPQGTLIPTAPPPVSGVALTAESFDRALASGLGGKSRAAAEFLLVRDYPEVLEQVEQVIRRLDARPRQVLVEALILRARLTEQNALGVDFNALAGIDFRAVGAGSVGGTNLTVGSVAPDALDSGELGAVRTDLTQQVPSGGLSVGIITNNVAMFVRALEEVVDLTVLANPKILALNEQPGRVIVGREDGFLTTTVTETATIQTVEFLETGTQILFRPFIASDGYVRMDIHPEDSTGGLNASNLPFKDTTEVTTSVLVKDGHTLVIGGLFRDVTTSSRSQVPWLGNVPLVGNLFRGQSDQVVREEVIVLITPHIIDGDKASAESQRMRDEVERTRVLAHRGLMAWGRERLAQAHYRWALEHQRAGRSTEALWDLSIALSLNPRFLEASRLRDRLLGQVTREPDMSIIHRVLERMSGKSRGTRRAGQRRPPIASSQPAPQTTNAGAP